jgi:predicted metalloprotease with PDZ domain
MNKIILLLLFLTRAAFGQESVGYLLDYYSGDDFLTVTIHIPVDARERTDKLVIPRSAPGTYAYTDYSAFFEEVSATTASGDVIEGEQGRGSYFTFDNEARALAAINYRVDLRRMESVLTGGFESSKLREDYLGLLGYSVFGFPEGLADRPVELEIRSSRNWPIFSTLAPRVEPPVERAEFTAASFATLADAQYLLGRDVQIAAVDGAPIPLFVAVYSEAEIDLDEIGRRALISLDGLAEYFGYVPMPHYTMVLEYLVPLTPKHQYGFWMEHLNSMTGSSDAANAIQAFEEEPRIGGIVHHMAHSWVPLRSYGEGYRPFEWQVAPLIETIWLNEGFAWYVAFYNVLDIKDILDFFRRTMASAPEFIRALSLNDLSRLGSTQYSEDFRIGRNLFSRGALMAHDLDMHIQDQTGGAKSFRDVMLGLLQWTEEHGRAFAYDEIEPIMSESAGVDLSAIWSRWQLPPH